MLIAHRHSLGGACRPPNRSGPAGAPTAASRSWSRPLSSVGITRCGQPETSHAGVARNRTTETWPGGVEAEIPYLRDDVSVEAQRNVRPGASGGAGNEAGSGFRAGAAAYVAVHILRGQGFADLELGEGNAVPVSMTLEADAAVDDLVVELACGGSAYLQAKTRLDFGRTADSSMAAVVEQWLALANERVLDSDLDRLVAAAADGSGAIRHLQRALRRRRRQIAGPPSLEEEQALERLEVLLASVDPASRKLILDCAVVWLADLEEADGLASRLGQALLEPGVVARDQGARAWSVLREHARELARRRYGATPQDLMSVLAADGLSLTSDQRGIRLSTARASTPEARQLSQPRAQTWRNIRSAGPGHPSATGPVSRCGCRHRGRPRHGTRASRG